jgi:hypothetical protein
LARPWDSDWSLPWLRNTVLRAGYGVNYQGLFAGGGVLGVDINIGTAPGLNHFANHPTTIRIGRPAHDGEQAIHIQYARGVLTESGASP